MAADGMGKRDDHHDLGDAMDIIEGMRFHMLGRQWQTDGLVWKRGRATAQGESGRAHRLCAGTAVWSVV